MRGACSSHERRTNEETRNAYRISARKREGRKPTGRLTYRWKNDIKVDLKDRRMCSLTNWANTHFPKRKTGTLAPRIDLKENKLLGVCYGII
jgi:hypothetical protein